MPKWTKEQNDAIIKSGNNIIVSAGAGSGKTAVLTERVIHKLNQGWHLTDLLVLTFTNAAARNMKEEIRAKIKENNKFQDELANIDIAYITTFDSFSLSIVKKYHYLLNITPDIRVVDSSIIILEKQELLNNIMEEFYQKKDANFLNLIDNYCNKDDKDLVNALLHFILELEKLGDYRSFLQDYLNKYFSLDYYDLLKQEYLKLFLLKQDELVNKLQDYSVVASSKNYEIMYQSLKNILNAQTLEEFITYSSCLVKPRFKASAEEKEIKDQINALKEDLIKLSIYGSYSEIKENINSTKKNVQVIIDIINEFFNRYEKIKLTKELYDFQDIALMAIDIVKNNSFVKEELQQQFKEIMIDEYQDTNDIQETFINLISNHNVYMVGDIKQSIYRFRNANPYLFKSKYDSYKQEIEGIKIDLLKNFRSREEVLNNINLIFNKIMDDFLGGADYLKEHQMIFGNNIYIEDGKTTQNNNLEIKMYDYEKNNFTKEEIEAFIIAQDIKQKLENNYLIFDKNLKSLRKVNYSDFVILMDRSATFNLYKKIFEYFNIPLTLYQDESFKDSEDLSIIKNILILLNKIKTQTYDGEFRYALVSVARSYLFEIKDPQIFSWFENNEFTNNPIYNTLKNISIDVDNLTNYELFLKIFNVTNIIQKTILVGDVVKRNKRLKKLLELATNLDNLGYNYINVIDYLTKIINSDNDLKYTIDELNNNSVKIMTIHKSKGLEYPICYYSGLYKEFNIKELNDKFLFNKKYGFVIPYYQNGLYATLTKELFKQDYFREEISEKIRLFYVALTRCKEKMIIVLPHNKKDSSDNYQLYNRLKYRSFADIIYSIEKDLNNFISNVNIDTLNLTKDYKLLKTNEYNKEKNTNLEVNEINLPFIYQEQKHFSKEIKSIISKKEQENIQLGLKIHQVLEMIDLQNFDESLITDEFIKEKIKAFLKQDLLKDILAANVYQEYEFLYTTNDVEYHGVIDLMLEYSNHIDIIDYKLQNVVDENYLKQLQGYKNYISTLTTKNINLYLYSIIDNKMEKIG